MKTMLVIGICLLCFQEPGHRVTDVMDLPGELVEAGADPDSGLEEGWYLEFNETWKIDPHRPGISKLVSGYKIGDRYNPQASTDSLMQLFNKLIGHLAPQGESLRLKKISYEFMLMEPPNRMLQEEVIALIRPRSYVGSRFNLENKLLSVFLHETWTIDPATMQIAKRVHGITPVIWQQRLSTEGEAVNDADSGLPVYYKINLDPIDLRNP